MRIMLPVMSSPRAGSTSGGHPGLVLKAKVAERGWTMEDLSTITGISRQNLSLIASGKRGITPDTATALAAAFSDSAEGWLSLDAAHQLSLATTDRDEVRTRAELYAKAPVREMQKRGWIHETSTATELKAELERFFRGSKSFRVTPKRSDTPQEPNPSARAWLIRARQLADSSVYVNPFDSKRMAAAQKKLRQLAAYAKEIERLSEMLAYYGIRFVVVEPLPGAKIDGAAFWLDKSPTIAVSARWDRIDALWFTVMHEFMHIKNGDAGSLDVNLVRDGENGISVSESEDEDEQRANTGAAHALIPKAELDSFVGRTSPLYASARIVQFAHRVKMHPGIVVGQLQHRGELRYSSHRSFLVKIRKYLVDTALTDGWGRSLGPGVTT